jgi:DNA-binding IclR family transcriptional regulator
MPIKSSTSRIRALLEEGYAYSEIHEITGYPKAEICRQANVLENRGVLIRKRTDAEMKRYLLASMQRGMLSDILDDLTLEEVKMLMDKSLVSWADAIRKTIRGKMDG